MVRHLLENRKIVKDIADPFEAPNMGRKMWPNNVNVSKMHIQRTKEDDCNENAPEKVISSFIYRVSEVIPRGVPLETK